MNKNNQIDRIKSLAKERGIKIKYICEKLGLAETYLSNVKNGKDRMTDDRLRIIADTLNTTPAYLNGETDKKEKPATIIDDGLTEEQKEIIDLFDRADPVLQRAALAMLRAAEVNDKDPDDV